MITPERFYFDAGGGLLGGGLRFEVMHAMTNNQFERVGLAGLGKALHVCDGMNSYQIIGTGKTKRIFESLVHDER